MRLSPWEWLKVGRGAANQKLKKWFIIIKSTILNIKYDENKVCTIIYKDFNYYTWTQEKNSSTAKQKEIKNITSLLLSGLKSCNQAIKNKESQHYINSIKSLKLSS